LSNRTSQIPYNAVHGQPLVPVKDQPKTKELTEDGDVPLSVEPPALTASLGSTKDTLNNSRDHAYANEFTVAVVDPVLGKLKTISQEKTGDNAFGWKSFWNSKPESSCLKLTID
jgi:hypothetical protein